MGLPSIRAAWVPSGRAAPIWRTVGFGLVGLDGDGEHRLGEAVGGQPARARLGLQLAEEAGLRVGLERVDHAILDVGGGPGAARAAGEDDGRLGAGGDGHALDLVAAGD